MPGNLSSLLCKTSVDRWAVQRLGLQVEVALKCDTLDDRSTLDQLFSWKDLVYSVHLPFAMKERRLNIAAIDDKWRNCSLGTLYHSLKIASRLEARKAVIHTAPRLFDGEIVGEYDRLIEGLRLVAAAGEDCNLLVCIENNRTYWDGCDPDQPPEQINRQAINTYFGVEPADWKNLIADTRHPNLRLCLDTSHAVTTAQTVSSLDHRVNIMKEFLSAENMISHVHWNDNYLFDTRGRADSHLPLNQGTIPIDLHRRVSKMAATRHLERETNSTGLVSEMEFINHL